MDTKLEGGGGGGALVAGSLKNLLFFCGFPKDNRSCTLSDFNKLIYCIYERLFDIIRYLLVYLKQIKDRCYIYIYKFKYYFLEM